MAKVNKTNAQAARAREIEVLAFELRKQGRSYPAIARELKISPANAHQRVTAVFRNLEDRLSETVPEVRRLELERLDHMLDAVWPGVLEGETAKVNTALRISERRAKILGYEIERVDFTSNGETVKTFTIDIGEKPNGLPKVAVNGAAAEDAV